MDVARVAMVEGGGSEVIIALTARSDCLNTHVAARLQGKGNVSDAKEVKRSANEENPFTEVGITYCR